MLQLGDNDKGKEVTLETDEEIEIHLSENPTTGYRWHVLSDGKPVVALAGDDFEAGTGVGKSGTHRWRFRAAQAGTCDVTLANRRSWEHGADPAHTFSVKVHVRK